jgi:glycerophosphoryl diester phosphodiesterase
MYIIGDARGERRSGGYAFRPIAHRGGSLENPENSLRAFQHAIRLGFTDLETDIRGTRDGVAVVHHDEHLTRTTDMAGRVRDLPWSDVRKAHIHGLEPIMRLEELLEALPSARITVDVKEDASVPALISVLERTQAYERVIVSSFSGRRLARVRRQVPVRTAASPPEVWALVRALRSQRLIQTDADSIAIPMRLGRWRLLTRDLVDHAHRCGLQVHVWTINDEQTMGDLIDLGVDGILTDRPTLLKQVVSSRNIWPT